MKKMMMVMCVVLMMCGCTTVSEPRIEKEAFFAQTSDNFFAQTNVISLAFMDAIFDGNESVFKRYAGTTLNEKITSEVLQEMSKDISNNYGLVVDIVYLGDFNNPLFRTAMYKVVFEKKVSGKMCVMEIPCQIGYAVVDGKPSVMMFNFASIL